MSGGWKIREKERYFGRVSTGNEMLRSRRPDSVELDPWVSYKWGTYVKDPDKKHNFNNFIEWSSDCDIYY